LLVSIGMQPREAPWGGGNQFGAALVRALTEAGDEVVHDLSSPDIDLILLTEPRAELRTSTYTDLDIVRYLRQVNPRALVVHRVNECDERKGSTGTNAVLRRANFCADHTLFVSAWLRGVHRRQGMRGRSNSVILNGSDCRVFNPEGHRRWNREGPLKLVTHHWSTSPGKGIDIYRKLDAMVGLPERRDSLAFTYIGNVSEGCRFEHGTVRGPTHGPDLADALRANHVYVTGSRNEPGSNHQNEGANCGLPLLYLDSASMSEYCTGFGVAYTAETFEQGLAEMTRTYDHWADRMPSYPHTAARMCAEYRSLFTELVARGAGDVNPARRRRWLRWRLLMTPRLRPVRAVLRRVFRGEGESP
jgi:hypothetical protein